MKKLLLSLVLSIILPMMVSAEVVEIDGIWYNLISKGKVAEVTSNPNYKGDIIISPTVMHEGTTFTVTSIGEKAFFCCDRVSSVTLPSSINNCV